MNRFWDGKSRRFYMKQSRGQGQRLTFQESVGAGATDVATVPGGIDVPPWATKAIVLIDWFAGGVDTTVSITHYADDLSDPGLGGTFEVAAEEIFEYTGINSIKVGPFSVLDKVSVAVTNDSGSTDSYTSAIIWVSD